MTFVEKYTEQRYIEFDDKRSQIVLSDKGEPRKYCAYNTRRQRVVAYRVDGGIVTDKTQSKCDYALWTENNRVYFIELKGGDYSHALEQISSTIANLVQEPKIDAEEIHARIVLSKGRAINANVANTHVARLKTLLKRYNGSLEMKTRQFNDTI